ncbi:MAG: sigma-70 family RNA polymerase sigma factor [Planctomycetes bacterium]|nr:sigma-70 family RNA polymerase sigma factor [Planctomycetota bacterium]
MTSRERTTQLLRRLSDGDSAAADDLYGAIRGELHRLAEIHLARRQPGHTLQSTALVHEAWLRLVDAETASFQSRGHFYAMASKVMRSILVDHARRKNAEKRGGDRARVPLAERASEPTEFSAGDVLDLHAALEQLEHIDADRARILELRYFGGLSMADIANSMAIPLRTAERRVQAATAWLRARLGGE